MQHLHSAHPIKQCNIFFRKLTLLFKMLATHVNDSCERLTLQHIASFRTGEFRHSAPPPFTSEGHTSKRDCSTSLTFTSIANEGSNPVTSPREGASAMLAELGTVSYHASMFVSHSQLITPQKIKLSMLTTTARHKAGKHRFVVDKNDNPIILEDAFRWE